MSIRNDLEALRGLFFPAVCPACGGPMGQGASVVCTGCRWEIPLTGYCTRVDNPVAEKFWGHLPLVQASSFMFFTEGSDFRRLVHSFKYHGGWRTALQMGRWYGAEMAAAGLYAGVDVVMAVPLHWRRRLKRGYNQSEYLAEGIAAALGKPADLRTLRRRVNNPSQTRTDAAGRWENVSGIFAVRHPESLQGRHVLLVDDVLTTGATLISCAETILAAAPGARISIATLAVSKKSLDLD